MRTCGSMCSSREYQPGYRSVAMLVMHFGHRDPEMHSHDATSYYAAIRPASAASHPYAVRHSFHNDFTPGCVACFARPTPGYRGLLDLAFGSPCLVVSNCQELSLVPLKELTHSALRRALETILELFGDTS